MHSPFSLFDHPPFLLLIFTVALLRLRSPPLLAPSTGPPLSSLLTFSLSCPPSVTVIRGDRGDQRRRRRTSSTDLSPPSPSAPCAKFASFQLSCCSFSSLPRFFVRRFRACQGNCCLSPVCLHPPTPSPRRAISERASARRACVSFALTEWFETDAQSGGASRSVLGLRWDVGVYEVISVRQCSPLVVWSSISKPKGRIHHLGCVL